MSAASWALLCCTAGIAGCLAGIGVGMWLTKRMREEAYRDGWTDGVKKITGTIPRVCRITEKMVDGFRRDYYEIPALGLARLEIECCRPERSRYSKGRRGQGVEE